MAMLIRQYNLWSMLPLLEKVCKHYASYKFLKLLFFNTGNLEISVLSNEKNVPTQVQPMGGAKFGVSFLPTQPFDHVVSITFNNIPVNGEWLLPVWSTSSQLNWINFGTFLFTDIDNPFVVNILPSTDKPIITGPALYFSPVDQSAKLTIHNVESENDIIAKVQGNFGRSCFNSPLTFLFSVPSDGNNQVVSVNIIKDIQNRCINLDFLPKLPGNFFLNYLFLFFKRLLHDRWIQSTNQIQGRTYTKVTIFDQDIWHQED